MYSNRIEENEGVAMDDRMYYNQTGLDESPPMDHHHMYDSGVAAVEEPAMDNRHYQSEHEHVEGPARDSRMTNRSQGSTKASARDFYETGVSKAEAQEHHVPKVSIFRRLIHGWTYQVYPVGLGSAAIYLVLNSLEYKSSALTAIQIAFFILSATIYSFTSIMLILQAILYPSRAASLVFSCSTTIFVPFLALNSNALILGLINYAVPAGIMSWESIEFFFYMYVIMSVCICVPLLVNWYDKPHDIRTFTPAWAFLVFPMMLVGTLAARFLTIIPPERQEAITVFFLGYLFQGLGTCMTFFYLPIYLSRIMQTGFMEGHQANGAFVAIGPPGFTAVALVGLGKMARPIFAAHQLHELLTEQVGIVFFGMGVFISMFLLGLCMLFFLMALIPYHKKIHRRLDESLGLWATTFPNVGMTITLRLMGDFFQSKALHRLQYIMVAFVCCAYVMALSCTLTALFKGKILTSSHEQVAADTHSNDHQKSHA
ncbi:hypothetical protein CROQUDRAFT_661784 [Cronartium quercuum f. sp. fusiforme G11]|uniref:Malic acid transport protein n=1 Tax=Cronartium quercuum f. sp. fusiforme G11 TaxID=708437 RepID=A0A9P6NCF9_9BASI|nr:hypothetical protein CROQUDRAFT_661784 [Cronartium quercuum f. sp. fusiforme G11]